MPAASVGPYRVLEHLGAGANGAVFLAEDTRLHRRVALKTLVAAPGGDIAGRRARLLREARAAARLNHPHIAAVYDVIEGEGENEIHIVMEHVHGTTLAARLRSGPLPPMQVLGLGLQLARALVHAHAMGVIHRDLKPANIMITPEGEAKILDFGLARLNEVEGSAPLSASGSVGVDARIAGTPPYIPPEVLNGAPADARGDLYSLGVTLFELLTGRRPFEARNGLALTAAILTAPTPRPRALGEDIPPGLDAIVYRAMSRDPGRRHASAADLAAELERASAEITDPSTRSAERGIVRRTLGTTRRAVGMAILSVAAIAAAILATRPPPKAAGSVPAGQEVIAVLPLRAGADDLGPIAAGLGESLTTALAGDSGLTVISREATLSDITSEKEPADSLARRLGATRFVAGSVQRDGRGVLRVNLLVLRPGSTVVTWAGHFDGTLDEVFALQNRVAAGLLKGLGVTTSQGTVESGAPRPPDKGALADYMSGLALLQRLDVEGNLDKSIAFFESAIRRDPLFARAHARLGEASWRKFTATNDKGWAIRALAATREALQLDNQDALSHYASAVIFQAMGSTREATDEAQTAIRLQPGNDEAHRLLGELQAGNGKLDAGLAEIRTAIGLRPLYWHHYFALGNVFFDAGRYAEALNEFRRATELQPDIPWAYQMLGTAYHALGDRAQAKENYERAIKLGGDARAYSNLGTLLYEDQRFPEAARAFEEAVRREPGTPSKHRNLGDVYARMGDKDRARASYRRAAELTREELVTNPTDFVNVARLAVYEAKLGHHGEAARLIARAGAGSPGNPGISYRQAVVYTFAGRLEDALRALEDAVREGYSVSFITGDDDLAPLRERPEYIRLVKDNASKKAG